MTYIKSSGFLFLFFMLGIAQAKIINMECDLKITTSNDWVSSETDNQKEVWTYDDQKGLQSIHTQYLLKECKLGEDELVSNTVAVRQRAKGDLGKLPYEEFMVLVQKEIDIQLSMNSLK